MYDELVKSIHYCFGFDSMQTDCENCMMKDKREEYNYEGCCDALGLAAADAIEQLTADLERSKEWEGFWKEQAEEAKGKLQQYALAVANKPRWIPVTERLPDTDGDYLVWFYDARCWKVAEYSKHTAKERHVWWFAGIDRTKFVTHWIPLPAPPKEEPT